MAYKDNKKYGTGCQRSPLFLAVVAESKCALHKKSQGADVQADGDDDY